MFFDIQAHSHRGLRAALYNSFSNFTGFYFKMLYSSYSFTGETTLVPITVVVSVVCVHVCLGRELIIPSLGVDYSNL